MNIFVTGATGFVGSAIVAELLANGHDVLGLARSEESAAKLSALGASALRGNLETLDVLREGAVRADAIIHAGFLHDFSRFGHACAMDRTAIEAMGEAIAGAAKPMIVTAGVAYLDASGPLAAETDKAFAPSDAYPRASEAAAMALSDRGIPVGVVRLAPSVHGEGDHAFVPMLIDLARRTGRSAYIGEGSNAWPAVHVKDAAACFRLAIERGPARGIYHAVAEEGVPFRDIAEAIAKGTGLPARSLSVAEAKEHFDWFLPFAAINQPTSSKKTQEVLGWMPGHATLIWDLEHAGYFAGRSHA